MSSSKPGAFNFKEIDPEGFETLSVISEAGNFNHWTYDVIKPYCSGKILEIGSGIGNISSCFIEDNHDITLSDLRSNYRKYLVQKFPAKQSSGNIIQLDLIHPDFDNEYKSYLNSFDTVFALNVIEHIEDDRRAIANCRKLLKKNGHLVILVPAFQILYNSFDKELHHYRRYQKKQLMELFTTNHLEIIDSFHFNAGGIPGWFVSGNIQKNKIIPPGQMKMFDQFVPVFKIIDRMLLKKVGLSVVCVGRKNDK